MRRPIARPGLSEPVAARPLPGAGLARFSPPNDGRPPLRFPYITATRIHWLTTQLTKLDWQILEFVATVRLANGAQLVHHLWHTTDRDSAAARAGRRTLKRLADWRVLDPLPRRIGSRQPGSESTVYSVGRAGARLLAAQGIRARTGAPGARYVAHTLICTGLVVELGAADRAGTLELIEARSEPACWRRFIGTGGATVTLKPDLFVRLAAGPERTQEDRWLIEADLATEASGTLQRKALAHLAYWRSGSAPVHPRVLWAVPDARRAEQLGDVLARLPETARRLFAVCLLDEAIHFLAAEARS